MSTLVAPSILTADLANLGKEVDMLNNSEADWIHFDVMDGVFVPNISFGIPVCASVKKITNKPIDVHLMIVNPEKYIKDFQQAGASTISVHYEACTHLHRTVQEIHAVGCKASVAINPHTPVFLLEDIIRDLDMVLIMSVNPGFGGQKFIENTYSKVTALKDLILRKNARTLIEVDGGVDDHTGLKLVKTGCDVLVSGSYVFQANDPEKAISGLKKLTPSVQV